LHKNLRPKEFPLCAVESFTLPAMG
jgi:hypothetical protein